MRAGEMAAGEEAEYAWLTQPSLKPFNQGDLFGDADAPRTGDTTLQACVAAAERAMHANNQQVRACWPGVSLGGSLQVHLCLGGACTAVAPS